MREVFKHNEWLRSFDCPVLLIQILLVLLSIQKLVSMTSLNLIDLSFWRQKNCDFFSMWLSNLRFGDTATRQLLHAICLHGFVVWLVHEILLAHCISLCYRQHYANKQVGLFYDNCMKCFKCLVLTWCYFYLGNLLKMEKSYRKCPLGMLCNTFL